jgi:hypothetical protein
VTINSKPVGNETVYIELAHTDQVTVSPLSMTFDRHNWNISVNVTVYAIDDPIDEGSIVYASVENDVIASGDVQVRTRLTCNPHAACHNAI